MAELFCDSFDWYGATSDLTSWWDTANTSGLTLANGANTAFNSGQSLGINMTSSAGLTKNWGSNETTIYGSIRFFSSSSVSASSCIFLQFQDGSNPQVSIRFNGDGSLSITTGSYSGSVITTLAGVVGLSQWNSFQFKIVIDPSAGTVNIRKNGSPTDLYAGTGLNTRGGSSNSYANTFTIQASFGNSNQCYVDDLFLNSGSGDVPNSWPGDPRALQQLPTANTQTQWTPNLTSGSVFASASTSSSGVPANQFSLFPFSLQSGGTLSAFTANFQSAGTGHVQFGIYDSTGSGGSPGSLIASSSAITNPSTGIVTFAYSGAAVTLQPLVTYYIGILSDFAVPIYGAPSQPFYSASVSYSSGLPSLASSASGLTLTNTGSSGGSYAGVVLNYGNYSMLNPIADGDTTYLQATASGVEDKFSMSAIATSYSILGVNYIALLKKTDSGTRTINVTTQANGSSETTVLTQSSISAVYTYTKSFHPLDPTGSSWTPSTVNGQIVGLSVAV